MGDYFPSEYKQFLFNESDLLASRSNDKFAGFAVNKILKIDRVVIKKGETRM